MFVCWSQSLMGVLLMWVHVHSEWPWLSCSDSSSGRVTVFVCSVLPYPSQRAGECGGLEWQCHCSALTSQCSSLPYIPAIVAAHSDREARQVKLTCSLSGSLSLSQWDTCKFPVRSPPPRPSVTTVATQWRPASQCSSRCLREDWTTATVCCHPTPRWWVNTPGPWWPQIR